MNPLNRRISKFQEVGQFGQVCRYSTVLDNMYDGRLSDHFPHSYTVDPVFIHFVDLCSISLGKACFARILLAICQVSRGRSKPIDLSCVAHFRRDSLVPFWFPSLLGREILLVQICSCFPCRTSEFKPVIYVVVEISVGLRVRWLRCIFLYSRSRASCVLSWDCGICS